MAKQNRWFIHVPEIESETFVFFYFSGDEHGRSWSIRDYTNPGNPTLRYAKDFPEDWSASDVLSMAGKYIALAETRHTGDVDWYRHQIRALNRKYLQSDSPPASPRSASRDSRPPMPDTPDFPIVDRDKLLAHRSGKALKRILTSPQSEDWVTWTVMRLLQRTDTSTWWPAIIDLAAANGAGSLPRRDAPPTVTLWRSIPAPPEYEKRSRARMAKSDNPRWRERARNPKAVEGPTEVDIALKGSSYSAFIEAKLHSDISEGTTYDPERNQILRNIDCAIEQAGGRSPWFWMFVKDRNPEWRYQQLIEKYRKEPESLAHHLPHRDPATLARMARGIAVIAWRELLPLLPDTPDTADTREELRRRVGAAA